MIYTELRNYQAKCKAEIVEKFRAGIKKVCLVMPCGAGKTRQMEDMAEGAAKRDKHTVFLVHRQELIKQAADTFREDGIDFGVIAPGYPLRDRAIQIASVQTVSRRLNKIVVPELVIPDECFVAGTMIGDKPIEQLMVGDTVPCFDEKTGQIQLSKVTHVFKNKAPSKLFGIKCDRANEIVCTENHPIFTPYGWVSAGELKEGDLIYADMSEMRGYHVEQKSQTMPSMLSEGYGGAQPERFSRENAKTQSYVDAGNQRKGNGNTPRDGAQAANARRKWKTTRSAPAITGGNIRMANGTHSINKTHDQRLSIMLQNRYSKPGITDSYRSGRSESLQLRTQSTGQKENSFLGVTRVDSIEVYEQGSNGEFTRVCPDGYVYNVEVETYGTYIANGIAVHNCHHSTAATWRRCLDYWQNAYLVGLTATPARLGGQGLSDVFDGLVIGPTAAELIQQGYLTPYKYYAPPQMFDTEGIKIKMGDFDSEEIKIRVNKPKVIGDAISHYIKYASGKMAIAYCASISHSKNTADAFNAQGIRAKHIDGTTPKAEREQAVLDFREGKITVLTNVDLFGEGLDCPGVEAVILLRPTQSLTLYIQQSMRGMRPDKLNPFKECVILDHVGNVHRHGLPDAPREWSLDGVVRRKKGETASVGVRQCLNCYGCHSPAPVCPYCGYEYTVTARMLAAEAGELKEYDAAMVALEKKKARMTVGMARTRADLEAIAKERGYSAGWVWYTAKAKKIRS